MLRSLEKLELIVGNANGLEVQMRTQGEMVEMALYLETLQFEESIKNGKPQKAPLKGKTIND